MSSGLGVPLVAAGLVKVPVTVTVNSYCLSAM